MFGEPGQGITPHKDLPRIHQRIHSRAGSHLEGPVVERSAHFAFNLVTCRQEELFDALLDFYTDKEGNALPDVLKSFDIDPARILEAKAKAGTYRVFLELHIEQSVVLEQNRKQIGIVTGIKGPHWIKGSFVGESNHAGGTPMNMRQIWV